MIWTDPRVRVFAYAAPCDMRKSFNTLSGLVAALGHTLQRGDLFLFVARNRKRAKVLWHDGTGLCLLAKRLDQSRFSSSLFSHTGHSVNLTLNELRLFIEGSKFVGQISLSPPPTDWDAASRIKSSTFV